MYKSGYAAVQKPDEYKKLYRNVLKKVDPMAVLEHYGAKNVHKNNTEIVHSCLLDTVHPHHSNGDSSPSASLNEELLLYNCWSYGGGDIVWFIQEMESVDRLTALNKLSAFISDPYGDTGQTALDMVRDIFKKQAPPASMPTYSKIILKPWRKIHPYLEERGISDEVVVRYSVGYDDEEEKIVFPHFWQGKMVGYQKRRLDYPWVEYKNTMIPKYKNSTDFPKDSTLYNYDNVKGLNEIIVVESVMSVLKAESMGIHNVVATFGGKVTDEQIEVLKEFARITVFMDSDPSGYSGTVKLYNGLKAYCKVKIIEAPEGKDLGDYENRGDILDVLATAQAGPLVIGSFIEKVKEFKNEKVR